MTQDSPPRRAVRRGWRALARSCASALALVTAATLLPTTSARAEGSWQLGMVDGPARNQPLVEGNLFELDAAQQPYFTVYVDILRAGEVITFRACGDQPTDPLLVQLDDPGGTRVADVDGSLEPTRTASNIDCTGDLTTPLDPANPPAGLQAPVRYVAPAAGTYELRMRNLSGNVILRYDVTVTAGLDDLVDAREDAGRVWTTIWNFNVGNYSEANSTSADLYVVADGGFAGTYALWQLDLNNFSGYVYQLKANDIGVTNTDPDKNVSGISVPKPNYPGDPSPGAGNVLNARYPIYLSYPAKDYPRASDRIIAWDFRFLDSDMQDASISPNTSGGQQDSGKFYFETNNTSAAIYEIVIDVGDGAGGGPDGVYGEGDVFLFDRVRQGGGTTEADWNGRDNLGQPVPEGYYTARLRVRVGEFHFVADDVEVSGGTSPPGVKIRAALSRTNTVPTIVYWDDVSGLPVPSTDVDAFNVEGIYDGDHRWGAFGDAGGPGNNTFIDTYTYSKSSTPQYLSVGVIEDDEPRAGIVKSFAPETVTSGETSTMRLAVTNNDPDDPITTVRFTDALPAGMTLAENPSALSVSGTGCSGFATDAATTSLGGTAFDVVDGTVPAGGTCTLEIDVLATLTDRYENVTSGVTSAEAGVGPASNTAFLRVVPGPSGAPLVCDGATYASGGSGSTRLYRVDRSSTPYTLEEFSGAGYAPTSGYTYDALGYNPADGYLYGVVRDSGAGAFKSGSVVRIENSGALVDLGRPVQGPQLAEMPQTTTRYTGGAFAEDGTYYVVTDGGTAPPANERSRILAIDVASSPPRIITNVGHGRDTNDIAVHPDGTIYGYTSDDRLVTIEPNTGSSASIGTGSAGSDVDAMSFDARGRLTLLATTSGTLYTVDLDTGATTSVATGAALADAGGASCATGVALDKRATRPAAHAGGTAGYEFTLYNASAAPVTLDLNDTLPDGRRFVPGSLVDPVGGTANDYGDGDTLTVSGLTIGAKGTATLSVEVRLPAATPVGTVVNQATLENLPATLGGSAPSDDPATPGAVDDPTSVQVAAGRAVLGAAKTVTADPGDPRVAIVELRLDNLGTVALSDVSVPDDLDAVFGAGNHSIAAAPVLVENPGTLQLDGAFTGRGLATDLLVPGASSLAPGATALIRFAVRVDTVTDRGRGRGVYANRVTAVSRDPLGGTPFDHSDDDATSDADGDGDPNESRAAGGDSDENDVTVFIVTDARAVSGRVFDDADVDGTYDVGERGLAGVTVVIRDETSGLCSSVRTDGDGRYAFTALPGPHTVHESAGASEPVECPPTARDPADRLSVTPNSVGVTVAAVDVPDVDFADVRLPTLGGEGTQVVPAGGGAALHPHVFTAFADGRVDLSTSAAVTPADPPWSSLLYRDANCDGRLDGGGAPIVAPFDVVAGERVCLLVRVSAPANAPADARHVSTLTASYAFADPAALGHALASESRRVDVTTALAAARGRLVLAKVVSNLSEGGAELLANAADTGDVLRYGVTFENTGGGPLSDLRINDATPAFTGIAAPVTCPATLPSTLGGCTVQVPAPGSNVAGYEGPIEWRFSGTLEAGGRGELSFDVTID